MEEAIERPASAGEKASAASDVVAGLRLRLSHVGVAVPQLGPATASLEAIFGYRVVSGPFDDPIQRVSVNFLTTSPVDQVEIELVAPLTDDSPVRAMLDKNGGGAYHLCFETADLEGTLAHAKRHGCMIVSAPAPAVAFDGRRIAWIYTATRQLFELVEARQPASAAQA